MPDRAAKTPTPAAAGAPPSAAAKRRVREPEAAPAPPPTWKSSWQAPALLGAVLLLAGGAVTALVTAPKPDFEKMLKQADALVERGDYQGALDGLNKKLLPYVRHEDLREPLLGEYFLLRARALYLGEKKLGSDLPENAEAVAGEYERARLSGATLEPRDTGYLADANVTLGKYTRAMELASKLPPAEKATRGRILKRVVEKQLRDPQQPAEASLKLLAEFLKDAELSSADLAWALARQAELLVHQGMLDAAISKLVQTMPSLVESAGPEALGELYLLLGRCYLETGAIADAGKQLENAAKLLLPTDPRWAEAMVMLGRVDELVRTPEEGRTEARAKYQAVVDKFAASEARLPALLGLAELEAQTGEAPGIEAALQAYQELVREINAGKKHPDISRTGVTGSLLDRAAARFSAQDYESALRFSGLAESLYGRDAAPAEVLAEVAAEHRAAAEKALGTGGGEQAPDLTRLDPATREQVRLHLLAAGAYYRRHADRVGVTDNAGYGRSLWLAADSYDLGGERDQAIALFNDYVKYFPGDARQPEARYRLARAYQSRGEYGTASEVYRGLVADGRTAGTNAGPLADASLVPLAQCLLMDAAPENDAEARGLLSEVIEGKSGSVGTAQYRQALVVMASMLSRTGDYAGAIQHLEEAVRRFAEDPELPTLMYNLADAHRLDAKSIARTLTEALPDSRKQLLTETRQARLRRAMELFDRVRSTLESRDGRRLSALERLQLRNSYFFMGDCAFELRDFDGAIRRYDAAREKYPQDPASMVAMIQIVNGYVEQGDLARAATAQQRAVMFYKSMPAAAWNDPDLPMTREDWQRWLDSMKALKPLGESAPVVEVPRGGATAGAGEGEH